MEILVEMLDEEEEETVEVVVLMIHWRVYRCGVHGHLAHDCPQSGQSQSIGSNSTKNAPSFKSGRGGPRRGRGRQVRFGGMGVVYDEEGNEYPVDDEGQIYIPYCTGQTTAKEWFEEEKEKDIKN